MRRNSCPLSNLPTVGRVRIRSDAGGQGRPRHGPRIIPLVLGRGNRKRWCSPESQATVLPAPACDTTSRDATTIHRVCYFTALLDARPNDPLQPRRQLVYLRALATLPGCEVHYGRFRAGTRRRPLADPAPGLPTSVLVRESEEKGSDVNLATRLLVDGFRLRARGFHLESPKTDYSTYCALSGS